MPGTQAAALDPQLHVAAVVSQSEIDAPIDLVWRTILDFPSYTKWNPFVRSQVIMDASWKSHSEDQKPKLGSNIIMKVHNPPALRMTDPSQMKGMMTKEVITHLDEDAKIIIWDLVSYPSWFLRSRRLQSVIEVDKNGKKVVKYVSVEVMDGIGAWIIKWFLLSRLQIALDGVADSLKNHSEKKT